MFASNPRENIRCTYVWLLWPNSHTGKGRHCLSTANKWSRKSSGSWPSISEHEKTILFIGMRPEPLIRSLGQYNCQQNLVLRKHLTGKLIKNCDFKGSFYEHLFISLHLAALSINRLFTFCLACVLVIDFVVLLSSKPPPCSANFTLFVDTFISVLPRCRGLRFKIEPETEGIATVYKILKGTTGWVICLHNCICFLCLSTTILHV